MLVSRGCYGQTLKHLLTRFVGEGEIVNGDVASISIATDSFKDNLKLKVREQLRLSRARVEYVLTSCCKGTLDRLER